MKKNRILLLSALAATQAFAQVQAPAMGNAVDVVGSAWKLVTVIGGVATAYFVTGLIMTGIKAVHSDHDQYGRLGAWAFWAIVCGGATGLMVKFAI